MGFVICIYIYNIYFFMYMFRRVWFRTCPKWSRIAQEWFQTPQKHFRGISGKTHFQTNKIITRPYLCYLSLSLSISISLSLYIYIYIHFLLKLTPYGSSGRSAKWNMLVHLSSFFYKFAKNLTFWTKT